MLKSFNSQFYNNSVIKIQKSFNLTQNIMQRNATISRIIKEEKNDFATKCNDFREKSNAKLYVKANFTLLPVERDIPGVVFIFKKLQFC